MSKMPSLFSSMHHLLADERETSLNSLQEGFRRNTTNKSGGLYWWSPDGQRLTAVLWAFFFQQYNFEEHVGFVPWASSKDFTRLVCIVRGSMLGTR